MPKVNVYLPDDLAAAVKDANIPVSAVCQVALERTVREVTALRATEEATGAADHGPFSRFTARARQALDLSQDAARRHGHAEVGTEHLLLGVLDEGGNLALKVLTALEVEPDDLRQELLGSLDDGGDAELPDGDLPLSDLAREALEATTREALTFGHNYIGCEHLLLGLLATEAGLASVVLRRLGVERTTARRAVTGLLLGVVHGRSQRPGPGATPPPPSTPPDTLAEILRRIEAIESRLASL
ncbi:MAG TPA: Clp protease N-terminal domain-containing protein [Acidimicrobiales bacterium]